jgi:hypothetical protein
MIARICSPTSNISHAVNTTTLMDFSTIASDALGVITPYLAKKGEKIAGEIGHDLWELIKKPFISDKEQSLIAQLEEHPDNAKTQGKVEMKLEELLEANPEIASELQRRLAQAGPAIENHNNTATVTGNNNNVVQGVNNSPITINHR